MLTNHLNSVIMHLPRIRTILVQQRAIGVPASPLNEHSFKTWKDESGHTVTAGVPIAPEHSSARPPSLPPSRSRGSEAEGGKTASCRSRLASRGFRRVQVLRPATGCSAGPYQDAIYGGMGASRGTHSEQRILRGDAGVMVWCYALPEFLAFSCELLPDFECEVWVCVRVVVVIGQRVKDWCFSDRHLGLLLRVEQCKQYATGNKFRD